MNAHDVGQAVNDYGAAMMRLGRAKERYERATAVGTSIHAVKAASGRVTAAAADACVARDALDAMVVKSLGFARPTGSACDDVNQSVLF